MPILVTDYNPQWPLLFDQLRSQISPALQNLAGSIEHIGSTSVPGLAAKPIIDITILAPDPDRLQQIIHRLDPLGYHHRGDLGVPGREAFSSPANLPAHHLYAGLRTAPAIQNHLALRDRLRANPDLAAAYGRLKKQLAAQFPNDIDAYIAGKTNFILAILRDAGFAPTDLQTIESVNTLPALSRPRPDERPHP